MKIQLTILASGNLGFSSLKTIREKQYEIEFVFTDNNSKEIISYCQQNKISFYAGNPNTPKGIEHLQILKSELFFSINYIFLLKNNFLKNAKATLYNIHGSLLPKYRGRTPHVWAIINGEKECGITIHKIDEGCDTGDILIQKVIPINENDTGGSILKKYEVAYPQLIITAIEIFFSRKAIYHPQDNTKSSFFPKRSPEDGEIDWSWNCDRILNWIRAQTAPYPGAFTYDVDGKKIIIWKAVKLDSTLGNQKNDLIFNARDGQLLIIDYQISGNS